MISDYYTYGTNLRNKEFFTSTVTSTSNSIKRYFSNIDAEIYFGNTLMEDIYEFQFSVEEKKLPIYSYNKYIPDLIVPGQRIVQGSFALNFTDGAYLRNVLDNIDDSILNTSYFDEEKYNPSGDNRNMTLYNKNFDITIAYGDYKSDSHTYNATSQTICGVQINSNGKAFSAESGNPILEVYSFIAKDFIDDEDNPYYDNNSNNNKDDDKNKNSNLSNTDSSNNSDDNNGNNKNENSPSNLKYKAVFIPEQTNNIPAQILLKITKINSDDTIDLSSGGKSATIEITDKNVINYNIIGDASKDFSKITTLTTRRYHNPSSNKIEYLLYFIKLEGSDHDNITNLNGQKNRPIHKRLASYCAENPDKKIQVKVKFTMKINNKTQNISKDLEMIYAPNGYDI